MDTVFLDFAKAFDKVDHNILLEKIKKHGIGGKIGKWIMEFLRGQKFRGVANGCMTREEDVISSVYTITMSYIISCNFWLFYITGLLPYRMILNAHIGMYTIPRAWCTILDKAARRREQLRFPCTARILIKLYENIKAPITKCDCSIINISSLT